jgi:hypothetical protein
LTHSWIIFSSPPLRLTNGAGQVRVIAGQYDDVSGPAHTFSPLNVWDMQLAQDGELSFAGGFGTVDDHFPFQYHQRGTPAFRLAQRPS